MILNHDPTFVATNQGPTVAPYPIIIPAILTDGKLEPEDYYYYYLGVVVVSQKDGRSWPPRKVTLTGKRRRETSRSPYRLSWPG